MNLRTFFLAACFLLLPNWGWAQYPVPPSSVIVTDSIPPFVSHAGHEILVINPNRLPPDTARYFSDGVRWRRYLTEFSNVILVNPGDDVCDAIAKLKDGGTIWFLPGTHYVTEKCVITESKVTFTGFGAATVFRPRTGATTIDTLFVFRQGDSSDVGMFRVEAARLIDVPIKFDQYSFSKIFEMQLDSADVNGLRLDNNSKDNTVSQVLINKAGGDGLVLNISDNNFLSSVRVYFSGSSGFRLVQSDEVIIANADANQNALYGIYASSPATPIYGVQVMGGRFTSNGQHNLLFQNAKLSQVTGALIKNAGTSAINTYSGIALDGSDNNVILGNTFYDYKDGVLSDTLTLYAVTINSTSDSNFVSENHFQYNTLTGLNDAGSENRYPINFYGYRAHFTQKRLDRFYFNSFNSNDNLVFNANQLALVVGGNQVMDWDTTLVRVNQPFELYDAANPLTPSVGQIAFDTDAWASGRGTIKANDGTSTVFAVMTLESDPPGAGEVPIWNANGTVTWGSITSGITIKEENSTVSAGAANLNFGAGFDLSESPAGQANVALDYAEDPVNLASGDVTGTLPVASGGTGVTSLSDILGTAEEISVSNGTARVIGGNVTLSLPTDLDLSGKFLQGETIFSLEGLTANGFETAINVVDPTADRTISIPNASGTFAVAATAPIALSAVGTISLNQNAGTDVTADLEEETHATEHQDGGADEISVTGLAGLLNDAQKSTIQRAGTTIGTRPTINFIQGANTLLTVSDNAGSNRVDVTYALDPSGFANIGFVTVGNDANLSSERAITQGNYIDVIDGGANSTVTIAMNPAKVGNVTWLDNADRTWTFDIAGAGTNPQIGFSSGVINIATGTLQQGGTAVVLQSRTINTTAPLIGGGALSGNLTLALNQNAGTDVTADLEEEAHVTEHQDGGADEISVTGLSGLLADAQKVTIRKNSAGTLFSRQQVNLIEGSNISITIADDAGTPETDITIAATASGASTSEAFVTIGNTAGLSAERSIVGTSNEIQLTDGGANSTLTLSLPTLLTLSSKELQGSTLFLAEGMTANTFETAFNLTDPTADNTITFPDATGTVAVTATAPLAISAAGDVSLTVPLDVQYGGTGRSTLTANGVLYGDGTSDVGMTAAGSANNVLRVSAGGAPEWGQVVLSSSNAVSGILSVTNGGTGANLSATGGSNQFVRQSSAGAAFTVSAIADADVPNTITLDNITQITSRDHGALQGLSDDDHTIYALLAGRSGGQTLIGGTDASQNLTLQSTSNVTRGLIIANDRIHIETDVPLEFEGTTVNGFETFLSVADPTDDQIITLPDNSGTIAVAATAPIALSATGVISLSAHAGTDVTADLEEETHVSEHQDGGNDEISVTGLSGLLADAQKVTVRKNSSSVGTRPQLNFIEGGNITLTVADDGTEIDVTIAATGSGGAAVSEPFITASASANLTAERIIAEGNYIDLTDGGANGNMTIAMDPAEVGSVTWLANADATWTFDVAASGTNPTITFSDNNIKMTSVLSLDAFGTSAGEGGQIRFEELAANGGNYVALRAPDALSGDLTFRLPTADGTSGQVLHTDGSGNMFWDTDDGAGASGAPEDASYITVSNNATLTAERVLAAGTYLDLTDGGANGNMTVAFDATEVGNVTFGSGGASYVWTWDVSSSDPALTFEPGGVSLSTDNFFRMTSNTGADKWKFMSPATSQFAMRADVGATAKFIFENESAGQVLDVQIEGSLLLPNNPLAVQYGGSGANLSATGGANQFVRQNSTGAAFTVSAIADADIPNTITLDNITQITTRDHGSLQGLTDDDHSIYALLAGRSSGQTLIGGSAASENLTLQSTANSTRGMIIVNDRLHLENQVAMEFEGATANGFETMFSVIDPTDDQTITIPDNTGTLAIEATAPIALSATGVISLSQNAGTDVTADLEEETHASEHQDGGNDEISVTGLAGLLADPQKVIVRKNSVSVGTQKQLNFIEGGNVTLTVADDGTEIDVTIAASGTGGGAPATEPYVTAASSSNLSAERVLAEGSYIDVTDGGANGNMTVALDLTEFGNATWLGNADATWTFDIAGAGTNPAVTFSSGVFNISSGTLQQGGTAVVLQSRNINTTAPIQGGGALSGDLTISLNQNAGTDVTADLEEETHVTEHQDGGNDEISVTGLSGILAEAQKLAMRKNSVAVGTRPQINFIEGSNVTLTVADDGTEIDVTIEAATGGSATSEPYLTVSNTGGLTAERALAEGNYIDLIDGGANSTMTVAFDPAEVGTITWLDNQDRSWTFDIAAAGTNPVLSFSANTINVSTGVLQQGGVDVVLESRSISTLAPLSGGGTLAGDLTLSITQNAGTDITADLEEETHASEHQDGGNDEISVTGLSGLLADVQKVSVRVNSGGTPSTRQQLNFIAGSGISLNLSDDAGTPEADITIATTGLATTGETFIVVSNTANLSAERALAGTTNEILLTDGGANSSMTISLPTQLALSTKELQGGTLFIAEGATADVNEAIFAVADVTADRTYTFPNASGEVTLLGQTIESGEVTDGTLINEDIAADADISLVKLEVTTGGGGKIIVSNASNLAAWVAMSGDVAINASGATTIQDNAVDGGDISLTSEANGDLMYYNGTDWIRLAIGTESQVLKVSSGAPAWGTDATGGGTSLVIEEGDIAVVSGAASIDFGPGFDAAESPSGEANITLDYTEKPVDLSTGETTGTLAANRVGNGLTDTQVNNDLTINQVTSGTFDLDRDSPGTNEGRLAWNATDNRIQVGDAGGVIEFYSGPHLTQEQVEDYTGGMVSGNTETLITVTYDDAGGKINFVVDNDLSHYSNANSGFITGNQTITLSGDATGSGTTTIVVTVVDDSHNHIITNIDAFTKAELEAQVTDVDDFAEADGDNYTGVHDFGAASSIELPNGAVVTTDVFGEIAGDNNAWASSRGAAQFYDGTANTFLVGTLVSDVPSAGQVPTFNAGGTITWESPTSSLIIEENDVTVATNPARLDFGAGFVTSESPAGEVNISFDYSEDPVILSGTDVTGTLPVTKGGTGVTALSSVLGTSNEISIANGVARVIGGDVTISLPSTLNLSGKVLQSGTLFFAEGATDDANETRFAIIDPTADNTISIPNASGEISLLGQTIESSEITDATIINSDIAANAAIALSKLQAGTSAQIIVANGSGVASYVNMSGDATIATDGTLTIANNVIDSNNITDGTIVNADIASGAAIALSKMATGSNAQIIILNASGVQTYVSMSGDATIANTGTITIAANAVDGTNISLTGEATGDVMYFNGTDWVRLAIGSAGQVLKVSGGIPAWQAESVGTVLYFEESDVPNMSGPDSIDFGAGFDLSESPSGELNIVLDYAEDPVDLSGADVVNILPATKVGLGLNDNQVNDNITINQIECGTLDLDRNNPSTNEGRIAWDATNNILWVGSESGALAFYPGAHSGAMIDVEENNSLVVDNAGRIDFGAGFDVSESPTGEANIVLDYTEDPVNLASAEITGLLPLANLAIGASAQIIVANGSGIPSYVSMSGDATIATTGVLTISVNAVDGTNISLASEATGDVMYFNGTDWVRLGVGSDGQVLKLSAGLPSWQADATGGSLNVEEGDVAVVTAASVIDFGAGFDVTNSPAGEANIVLDYTEDPVNLSLAEVTGTLPVARGGTGVTALSDVLGTANEISVTNGVARVIGGNVTLSLPGALNLSGKVLQTSTLFSAEGASDDGSEITFVVADPTVDRTITFPNASGDVSLLGQTIESGEVTDGTLINEDIASGADISLNKLELTIGSGRIIVSNASNLAAWVAMSGDVAINASGATTIQDNAVDGSDINISGEAAGSIAYHNGTDWVTLGIGTAGQVLKVSGSAPAWSTDLTGNLDGEPYITAALSGNLSAERVLTEGNYIDVTDGGANGNMTVAFDATEVKNITWGDGTVDVYSWWWHCLEGSPNVIFRGGGIIQFDNIVHFNVLSGQVSFANPLGVSSGGTGVNALSNVLGTTNEVSVTNGTARVIGGNVTISLPSTLDLSGKTLQSNVMFSVEGSSNDVLETTFQVMNPTADQTITFPNATGTVSLLDQSIESSEITDGTIANVDISASAGIALSKLASGSSGQIIVANVSGVPTYVAMSGDATISNAGALTIADNAIDGGDISISGEANGSITYHNGTDWVTLGIGTTGQVLKVSGGLPAWVTQLPSELSSEPYIVASLSANLSAERVIAEGSYIDITDGGANGNMTIAMDPTEVGSVTWGNGGSSSYTWTYNISGIDPSLIFSDFLVSTGAGTDFNVISPYNYNLRIGYKSLKEFSISTDFPGSTGAIILENDNSADDVLVKVEGTLRIRNPLSIYDGGTGADTFIDNGIVFFADDPVIPKLSSIAGTSGQFIIWDSLNYPYARSLSGDATLSGTGVLTIADNAVDGSDITISGEANGSMMYYFNGNWVNLPPGSEGQVLKMIDGSPTWVTP